MVIFALLCYLVSEICIMLLIDITLVLISYFEEFAEVLITKCVLDIAIENRTSFATYYKTSLHHLQ